MNESPGGPIFFLLRGVLKRFMQKVILGVAHAEKKELQRIWEIINQYSPKTVGIELSEDYIIQQKIIVIAHQV